jgi:hypothetical protein
MGLGHARVSTYMYARSWPGSLELEEERKYSKL